MRCYPLARAGFLRLTVLAAAVGGVADAWSQEAVSEPVPASAASPGAVIPGQIQEVIVTAQKRKQSAQKTPMAVSVVSGEEIAGKAQNTLDSVLRNVPGVEIQGIAQGSQIYVRGVGSSIDPTYADPAVALMVDGAYLGRTESSVSGTYDIDRVEVLSGPQGTLYGRNATGGVVNVLTANPQLDKFSGNVRVQVGNHNLKRGELALNIPLNDISALRLAAFREKRDGYVDDGSMDSNNAGVRAKYRIDPADWLTVLAKAEYYKEDVLGMNTVPIAGSAGNLTFPPPLFATNFDPTIAGGPPFTGGAPVWRFPNGWQTNSDSPWSNDATHRPGSVYRTAKTASLQVDADLRFGTLTVLPVYTQDYNVLTSNYLFGTLAGPYDEVIGANTYRSIEARLANPADASLKWLVGAYYLKATTESAIDATQAPYAITQNYLPAETKALFGQLTYPFAPSLRGTLGLRFSKDSFGQSFEIRDTGTNTVAGSGSQQDGVSSSQYKVGLEYDLGKRSMLYAHLATGFKQGGLSPSVPASTYAPENLKAFEIGSKNRFLDNRLQLNADVFLYRYHDYQIGYLQTIALGNTGSTYSTQVVTNARTPGRNLGAELSADWRPGGQDRIRASATYLDATYGQATLPDNPFSNQGSFELEGRQMQNSPRWAGTFAYDHTFELGAGSITAGIQTKLSSSYYVTQEQYLPGAHQAGYSRSDATLRYDPAGAKWSLSLWAKNLENKAQTTYIFPAYRRFVTAPRTFGISAEYRF
jgi:iron complex outermembrane receptor protein